MVAVSEAEQEATANWATKPVQQQQQPSFNGTSWTVSQSPEQFNFNQFQPTQQVVWQHYNQQLWSAAQQSSSQQFKLQ
jgi:hypothetical protein